MKQIYGNAHNISAFTLGRITFKPKCIFNRKDTILVKYNAKKIPSGYAAVITNTNDFYSNEPFVCDVKQLDIFNEGDVVLINPDGRINFLYEIHSEHNAIFVTELCNHRCIMCPQPPVATEKDKTMLNLKLISLFDKNTQNIGITGGEPTMIGDKLFDIIYQIQKYCPKASINILSNGVKFENIEYAIKLAKCKYSDLQVDIPIFSDIAYEHNKIVGANTFYRTVKGIYNLGQMQIPIGLRIVVHKQTYKRLAQLSNFIYHNFPFVTQVAFMQMETNGLAKKNINN